MSSACAFCQKPRELLVGVRIVVGSNGAPNICARCVAFIHDVLKNEGDHELARPGNRMQRAVHAFRVAMGQRVGSTPAVQDAQLASNLIEEEAKETVDAIRAGDLVGAVDGLCDLLYVAFGAAVAFGVDLQPAFDLVHAANMSKASGPVRADGKREKPPGFQHPDIAGELMRQRAPRPAALESSTT